MSPETSGTAAHELEHFRQHLIGHLREYRAIEPAKISVGVFIIATYPP
jgi:predicted RNA-binding protein with PIN domain